MSASVLAPVIASLQSQINDISDYAPEIADLSGEVGDLSGRVAVLEASVGVAPKWGVWGLSTDAPITGGTTEVVWDTPEAGTDNVYVSAPTGAGYFLVNISGLYQLEYHHFYGEASPGTGAWSSNTRFGSRLVAVIGGQRTLYETSAYPPSSGSGGEPSDGGGARVIYLEAGNLFASSVICNPPGAGTVSNAVIYGNGFPNPEDFNSYISWVYLGK